MKLRKNIYALSISAAILTLAGCGITPQDEGLGGSSSKAVSGVVVDGYLAGATVYIDVNENNKLDAWEVRALTDMKGYFSYNPVTSVNYCELPATDSLSIHCLRTPAGYDDVLIRMTQGYDLSTAEPFTGTITMRLNVASAEIMSPVAATPITGLLAEVPIDQIETFLSTQGLTSAIAGVDFLDFSTASSLTETERRSLLSLALQAHKVAIVVADFLDPLYGAANASDGLATAFFGENANVPVDVSSLVYKAMVSEALRTGATLNSILSNATSAQLVIEVAIDNINADVIDDYNNRLPKDEVTGLPSNQTDMLKAIALSDVATGTDAKVATVASTIKTVFSAALFISPGASPEPDLDTETDATSRIRAIDAVVSMTLAGEAAATAEAVTLSSDATYLLNLRSPKVNMVSMKAKLIAGETGAAIADFNARQSFNELLAGGNSPFTSTDGGTVNDLGFAGNKLDLSKDSADPNAGSVAIDFVGTPDANGDANAATSGTMTIDANSLGGDFAKTDSTGATVPLELNGTWEKVDDYTMIMNIEVTDGVFEPVIVKPNDDGTGYYFDLGGEQIVWE